MNATATDDPVRELHGYSRAMLRLRAFEEAVLRGLQEKLALGAIHPAIGQEAIAIGFEDG